MAGDKMVTTDAIFAAMDAEQIRIQARLRAIARERRGIQAKLQTVKYLPREGTAKRKIYDLVLAGLSDAEIKKACRGIGENTLSTHLSRMKKLVRDVGQSTLEK